jgi:murein L,D-transpeptidase YafK
MNNKITQYLIIIICFFLFALILTNKTYSQISSSPLSKRVAKKLHPVLTKELEEKGLKFGSPVFIRIFKFSYELEVWVKDNQKYKLFKSYDICYFSGKLGPKLKRGDLQSPEGFYFVKPNKLNPYSQFHLSFDISYPNTYDKAHRRTGGLIMIHGDCVSIGCYAMTDKYIEEIYTLAQAALKNGQPFFRVHIFPFRMTEQNMLKYKASKWIDFWKNLKQGYDYFEKKKIPPNVTVKNRKYVFEELE